MAKPIEEIIKLIRAVQTRPPVLSATDDMAYVAYLLGTTAGRLRHSQLLTNEDVAAVMVLIQPPATPLSVVRQIWPAAEYATRPLEFDDESDDSE